MSNFAACCSFHHSALLQVLLLASGNIFPLSGVYNNEEAGLDLERAMCTDKIKLLLRN